MTHAGDGPRSEPQMHLHQPDQMLEGEKNNSSDIKTTSSMSLCMKLFWVLHFPCSVILWGILLWVFSCDQFWRLFSLWNVLCLADMEFIFPWQSSQCCSLCWQLERCCCHAGAMAFAGHSSILPLTTGLGMGNKLGGDTATTADSNRPKDYSIPHGTCSAITAKRKEFKRVAFVIYDICVLEQLLQVLNLCFLRSGQTLPADRK